MLEALGCVIMFRYLQLTALGFAAYAYRSAGSLVPLKQTDRVENKSGGPAGP